MAGVERELVVLVHGIWMPGSSMLALSLRLREQGFRTVSFSYASVRRTAASNADRLHAFAATWAILWQQY